MPLIQSGSKKAISQNIKREMHAGKPQKQSIAIAYAVKRRAKAAGGEVQAEHAASEHDPSLIEHSLTGPNSNKKMHPMAHGGMIENLMSPEAIVRAIQAQHSYKEPMEEHDSDMEAESHSNVEPMEHTAPDAEDLPEHMLAKGGMLGEAEPSSDGMDEEHAARMAGDQSNFLSDEENMETPFHSTKSDEEELDEHDMGAHPSMHNQTGDLDEETEERKLTLGKILKDIRMRHLGKR